MICVIHMPDLDRPENDYYGATLTPTSISLYDGHHFDICNPDTWVWNIDTISISLANTCRYRGHCEYYSVAEHAVRVSKKLEEWGENQLVQYLGLHHDDVESIIGDIPSPHKNLITFDGEPVRELEQSLEYTYFYTLGVLDENFDKNWARVKEADLAVYYMERDERPYCGQNLGPLMARAAYRARHHELAWLFAGRIKGA